MVLIFIPDCRDATSCNVWLGLICREGCPLATKEPFYPLLFVGLF